MKLVTFPQPERDVPRGGVFRHDNGRVFAGQASVFEGRPCVMFELADDLPNGNGAALFLDREGSKPTTYHGVLRTDRVNPATGSVGFDVDMLPMEDVRPSFSLPVLEPRGRYFWQNGQRFFLNGATAFNAFALYLQQGEGAVSEFLHQRQELGFNAARIWTAYNIPLIGRLVPREVPGYYDRMLEMNALCAAYGQYPYWTVFAGANAETLGGRQEMLDHLRLMGAALDGTFALMDEHNEYGYWPNDESKFIGPNPPSTVLWSQGSGMQDAAPPQPFGRFYAYHPASQSEWQRKVGKQNIDFAIEFNLLSPGVDDETVRLEPNGETNVQHVHDAAQQGAFFGAGAFMHSAQAKRAALFIGPEHVCAVAWNAGVRGVPLDIAQEGRYEHLEGQEGPGILRVYRKTLGDRSHTITTYA